MIIEKKDVVMTEENGVFFGYMEELPGICAQADTEEEVLQKMNKYFEVYINSDYVSR